MNIFGRTVSEGGGSRSLSGEASVAIQLASRPLPGPTGPLGVEPSEEGEPCHAMILAILPWHLETIAHFLLGVEVFHKESWAAWDLTVRGWVNLPNVPDAAYLLEATIEVEMKGSIELRWAAVRDLGEADYTLLVEVVSVREAVTHQAPPS